MQCPFHADPYVTVYHTTPHTTPQLTLPQSSLQYAGPLSCRYGVGQIYFRQEKYEMAEYHFRRSLLINQRSSVLRCYVGVALHKIGRAQDALDQLQVQDSQQA